MQLRGLRIEPPFVVGVGLVLDVLLVLARFDQIGRFHERLQTQGEQMIEIDLSKRVIGSNANRFLQNHRPFIQSIAGSKNGESGLAFSLRYGPVDGAWSTVFGQQGGVVLDGAQPGRHHQFLGDKLKHIRHHTYFSATVLHQFNRICASQIGQLNGGDAARQGSSLQRVGFAGLGVVGRTKHRHHLVSTV